MCSSDLRVGVGRGAGHPRRGRSGPPRLVLEMLLWLVGRYSEQGVLLHVCSKAFQRRLFGMTSSEVGARRALGAVGGAWRDSATMCYSGSGGVLPGPVALRALEGYRNIRWTIHNCNGISMVFAGNDSDFSWCSAIINCAIW